jgi:hypothetical protein
MKKKIGKTALAGFALVPVLFFAGCDMEVIGGGREDWFDSAPGAPVSTEHSYFVITNLPANVQASNVSDVFVYNQTGKIAECEDYGGIVINPVGGGATLSVPLSYLSGAKFAETGSFFVSFDVNVDALTRIRVLQSEKLTVPFLSGNGILNAFDLPQSAATRYLTLVNLPPTVINNCFSDVAIYNYAGKVARCSDYSDIVITTDGITASAHIPIIDNSSEPFRNTGNFVVEFTCDVDAYSQISVVRKIPFITSFSDGAGVFDVSNVYGYFEAALINPADATPPRIRVGSTFEMNGTFYEVEADTLLPVPSLSRTSIVYVYAKPAPGGYEFTSSTVQPVYSAAKGGYYNGLDRALYTYVYIHDTTPLYAAKTATDTGFTQFYYYTAAPEIHDNAVADTTVVYTLSGAGNPSAQTVTLQPGAYFVELKGAGGGGGGGLDGANSGGIFYTDDNQEWGTSGGTGGFLFEVLTLKQATTFTVYTGGGGNGAAYTQNGQNQGTGGGGGGAGSFIYNPSGYFTVAGGGGGGSGTSVDRDPPGGGGGGAGGSIGPGAAGGKGGDDIRTNGSIYRVGTAGGPGGGAPSSFPGTHWGYAGGSYSTSSPGESAEYISYPATNVNNKWKNTNGANGSGATHRNDGGAGGNNRNATRGGGAAGGYGGDAVDGGGSAGGPGEAGSVIIYAIE